jgi:hypothetical protein
MQYWKGCEGVQNVIILKSGKCDGAGDSTLIIYDVRASSVLRGSTMTEQHTLLSISLEYFIFNVDPCGCVV